MKHTVHFKDVGRNNKSWSKEFHGPVSEVDIAREVKKSGALMSSDIDAEFADGGASGSIIVGGWRSVGIFTVEKAA